ncbi:MAG: element excision factor XisI family protein [Limnospira sp.]
MLIVNCLAGVSKNEIVLGFKSPELRKDTEFAIA